MIQHRFTVHLASSGFTARTYGPTQNEFRPRYSDSGPQTVAQFDDELVGEGIPPGGLENIAERVSPDPP